MTVISPSGRTRVAAPGARTTSRAGARTTGPRTGTTARPRPGAWAPTPRPVPVDEPLDPLVAVAVALVGGLLLGIATEALQGMLPGAWNSVANSIAVWSLVGACLGSRVTGRGASALVGMVTLLSLTAGYYAAASLQGVPHSVRYIVFWSACAVVGGVVFGIAGSWCRFGSARERVGAAAVLGGVLTYEGLVRAFVFDDQVPEGLTMLVLGLGVPLLVGRTRRERLVATAALVPTTVLALGAYALLNQGF